MASKVKKVLGVLTLAVGAAGAVAAASPASASGYSAYGYGSPGYFAAACYNTDACNQTQSGNVYPANGTSLNLHCYFDSGQRYFLVNIGNRDAGSLWVVQANQVRAQYSTPHC